MGTENNSRKLGIFDLGGNNVALYARPGSGGSFQGRPENDIPHITIGLDADEWGACATSLVHEALEYASVDLGCRFVPNPDYGLDSAGYAFFMRHDQFGEAVARATWFLVKALPVLANAYNQHKRAKKDKP